MSERNIPVKVIKLNTFLREFFQTFRLRYNTSGKGKHVLDKSLCCIEKQTYGKNSIL